jgi:Outer membrane protein beta-barrel domain
MRQVRVVRSGVLVATVLGMLVAPAIAQDGTDGREHQVTRLGGTTRFSQPMHTLDDLRAMVQANRSAIRSVMVMAGYGDVSAQLTDGFSVSEVTDTTIAPGSRFLFMGLKRGGAPAVLRNVRWAGRDSFDAWQFKVTVGGYVYSFIVPKVCGNFSLVSRVAVPVPSAPPPPAPEPPPPPPPPAPEPPPPPPPPPPPVVAAVVEEETYEPWIASFNVGNYFSASGGVLNEFAGADINRSVAFGGQVAYLWRNNIGAEFLADFAPTFKVPSLVISDHPNVQAYMANAIYGFRVGWIKQFRPYISGGIGAINMNADLITLDTNLIQSTISASQTRFGGNVGVGGLGYFGHVGVRGDIRYFRANSDTNFDRLTLTDRELLDNDSTLVELSGIRYWRSSLGVAFRW